MPDRTNDVPAGEPDNGFLAAESVDTTSLSVFGTTTAHVEVALPTHYEDEYDDDDDDDVVDDAEDLSSLFDSVRAGQTPLVRPAVGVVAVEAPQEELEDSLRSVEALDGELVHDETATQHTAEPRDAAELVAEFEEVRETALSDEEHSADVHAPVENAWQPASSSLSDSGDTEADVADEVADETADADDNDEADDVHDADADAEADADDEADADEAADVADDVDQEDDADDIEVAEFDETEGNDLADPAEKSAFPVEDVDAAEEIDEAVISDGEDADSIADGASGVTEDTGVEAPADVEDDADASDQLEEEAVDETREVLAAVERTESEPEYVGVTATSEAVEPAEEQEEDASELLEDDAAETVVVEPAPEPATSAGIEEPAPVTAPSRVLSVEPQSEVPSSGDDAVTESVIDTPSGPIPISEALRSDTRANRVVQPNTPPASEASVAEEELVTDPSSSRAQPRRDPHELERVSVKTDAQPTLASKRFGDLAAGRGGESADLLTADRLLDPTKLTKPEPEGAWTHFVYRLSGKRINLGDGKAARERKALIAQIAAPLSGGSKFVPVLSRKGGVGKTTVSTLLGMALADARDDRVIAVDANPDRGTLAERIGRTSQKSIRDLVRVRNDVRGYNDLSALVARDETRLDVLASDSDPRVAEAFSDEDYRQVAELISRYYSIVLTDTGTGIVHSVMGATLDLADQIVLAAGTSLDSARAASETLTWLETNGFADLAQNAIVVVNQTSPGAPLVRLDELESHFRTRVREVIRLPYDSLIASGSAISFRDLQPETRHAARVLAARVVAGLRQEAR